MNKSKRDIAHLERSKSYSCASAVTPRNAGIFKTVNKEQVAQLWGDARNRTMSYDSLSRGLRHYYSQGLLNAVNKKLHYQFTQKALDEWEVIRDKDLIEVR